MPRLAADSPARMLSPPISVKREQFALSGVGNAVQVRQVSQEARSEVGNGYAALLSGDYARALDLYERALKAEPSSVMAQLGRGAAAQKLGRMDVARQSYEAALKLDPLNREALTNLTGLIADREPNEALKRLHDLEVEYPGFSPIQAQIGAVHARLEHWEDAIAYLKRAVTLTPEAPMYQYNLAIALDRANLREQAVIAYRQALALVDGRAVSDLPKAAIQRRIDFLLSAR
jgi:tetratricopeptide (TPR) repeat protein